MADHLNDHDSWEIPQSYVAHVNRLLERAAQIGRPSGCLLAAFPADRAKAVLQSLAQHGHAAAQIGTAEPGSGVCDADGRPLAWPGRDEVARLLSDKTEGPG